MTPAFTFLAGLAILVLFGWYFATDQGLRKRLLAMTLVLLLVDLQHCHDLAAAEEDRARPRHSRRHFLSDPAERRR